MLRLYVKVWNEDQSTEVTLEVPKESYEVGDQAFQSLVEFTSRNSLGFLMQSLEKLDNKPRIILP